MIAAMGEWRRVLRPSGSILPQTSVIRIGKRAYMGFLAVLRTAARSGEWILRNRIVWVKEGGMPDPVRDRLANRHEYILHFAGNGYYYDLFGYAEHYSQDQKGANPGDVWKISLQRNLGKSLAPFPREIAERAITLACPRAVCCACGKPRRRIVERTMELDASRPQARRALAIAEEKKLTREHIAAIQATGISDAGKARRVQNGTDRNAETVRRLAQEAKTALGGYFREFTFAKRRSCGWSDCGCAAPFIPGVVLDPFMGTGTTLDVANQMGRSAIGVDLDLSQMTETI